MSFNMNFKNNEIENLNLFDELNRFDGQRNGCELLLQQTKLVERFFNDSEMNDLEILMNFFAFMTSAMGRSRQNATKLVLRLPGSKLLKFAYDHLKPSAQMDNDEEKLFEKFVLGLSNVLKSLLELHPFCFSQIDSLGIFDRLETYSLKSQNEDVQLQVTTLSSQVEELRQQMTRKQKPKVEIQLDRDDPPPDDFHQLSIYPTLEEIFQPQIPYLRKNITKGQYKNGTHYLDIHFRLLREDFLGPLREAICQYMSDDDRDISFRNSNVRLYRNTILTNTICSNTGILFSLALDPTRLPKSISWANSRRLIYGNLLCATFDNFASGCFLLTVEDRSNIDKDGTISVRCQKELSDHKLMRLPPGTSFTLLETTSYFEAYRPILQALQNITDDHLPLEPYLLHCEKNVAMPNYFEQKSEIDFRPILAKNIDRANEFEGTLSNVKDLATWPNAEQLGLDDSQYKALQLAITKSVALIQGPPGCGKTFLGVRLAELFYHNRERITGCQRPILMICYTNHALDQFLSSIIRKLSLKPGEIVRVGGRSTHSEIEPFLIQKLRHQRRDVRLRNEELSVRYDILNNIRKQLDDCQTKYYRCSHELLDATQLLQVMDRNQFLTFIEPILSKLDIYTDHWSSNKGGLYCCRSKKARVVVIDSDESDDSSSSSESDDDDGDGGEILSEHERAVRMRNRTDCRKLNDLSEHDQNEIKQLIIQWLDYADISSIIEQLKAQNEDDGEGEFQEQRKKQKKRNKAKAEAVLTEILNDPMATTTNGTNKNDENPINVEEDEEETRRLENLDDSYIPFTVPNRNNEKTKAVNIEQLEYIGRLLNNKTAILPDDFVGNIKDLWSNSINKEQRQGLYRHWLGKYVQHLIDGWFRLNEQYDANYQSMQELWLVNDSIYMEKAFVIAMTTHCASRYQKVLKKIAPRICIVEEAAEVFESHIVTAIGEQIEHLILIGDHIQLRPSPNVYTLAKNFNLDVSLFERLIKNDMPSVQLCVQHRSIPIISSLTHHFYDIQIENHSSVLDRRAITGVVQPLYFINHDNFEENVQDGASKRNSYECQYVLQLADYLINQGYEKSEITILTTYMGQRQLIQKTMNQSFKHLKGIHATVVDNFQGEENRIILLSLVRSNADRRLGYIAVDNRICVALSRAQDGFYVIGNFNLLIENETWKTILNKVKKLNQIGAGLTINCANHPDNQLMCKLSSDFLKRPLGGCGLKCETRLDCGHQCPLTCHNTPHNSIVCAKPCLKQYDDCEHQCHKKCHSPNACPPCYEMITLKMPDCEHTSEIPCVMRKTNQVQCAVRIPYKCPNGHQVQIRCSDFKNTELRDRLCTHPCDFKLECGHTCKGTCSTCLQGRFHHPCDEQELVVYMCGHSRYQRCHELGPRCEQQYIKLCDHDDQPVIRSNEVRCVLYQCMRYCLHKCKHLRCPERCKLECNRPPCYEKCSRRFECEHYCNGICGEPCIPCLVCRQRTLPLEIQRAISGKNLRNATFVELECGHLFKTDELDAHVETFKNKNFRLHNFMYVDYPRCPTCQFSMVKCKRYAGLIKKIQSQIANISSRLAFKSESTERSSSQPKISLKDIKLPEEIAAIIKENNDNERHEELTELLVHVIGLFQKMASRVDTERDVLLKSIYERVKTNNSIFFTRQQWSDLENEYNRLLFIEHFQTMKELLGSKFDTFDVETLGDILFGPNSFSKLASETCNLLLQKDGDNEYKWKSILPNDTEWNDFDMDRRICDNKWVACSKGSHMIWWDDDITEQIKCPACVLSSSETPRGNFNRGSSASLRSGFGRGGGFSQRGRYHRP